MLLRSTPPSNPAKSAVQRTVWVRAHTFGFRSVAVLIVLALLSVPLQVQAQSPSEPTQAKGEPTAKDPGAPHPAAGEPAADSAVPATANPAPALQPAVPLAEHAPVLAGPSSPAEPAPVATFLNNMPWWGWAALGVVLFAVGGSGGGGSKKGGGGSSAPGGCTVGGNCGAVGATW
jgi:hypothetical protein